MKLYDLVHAKTGYITPELFQEARQVAIKDVKANRESAKGTWIFDSWSKAEKLQYIADAMVSYIFISKKY